jgi:hypothetical protein
MVQVKNWQIHIDLANFVNEKQFLRGNIPLIKESVDKY